jgi:DNA polymerase III delta prime subunit
VASDFTSIDPLKDVGEIAKLTMTRDEDITPRGVSETRRGYNKLRGITQVDGDLGYYLCPSYLKKWMDSNKEFFTHPAHPSLMPRGLLFDGPPGTGKTLASKYIANEFGVPLYRLDLGAMMGKYVGGCHAEGTAFLTSNGVKKPEDISSGDLLATRNMDTGELEFQAFTNRQEYQYSGEMIEVKTKTTTCLVTPNHRMIMARPGNEFGFKFAGEIGRKQTQWLTPTSTKGQAGEAKRVFYLAPKGVAGNPNKKCGGVNALMTIFLEFLGYFLSEGHTQKNKPGYICLSQNPGQVADKMIKVSHYLANKVGVVENRGNLQISFSNLALWHWLNDNCGINSQTYKIPRQFLTLPQHDLRVLMGALNDGDGSVDKKGRDGNFLYATTSKELAANVEELALRIGMTARIREHDYHDGIRHNRFSVYASPRNHANFYEKRHVSSVPYEGNVYCFTVPNGTLLTRYQGTWLVSGNSSINQELI